MDPPQTRASEETRGALREGLIQNAVNFLSDPRVKDSSLEQRRSFLLGKGLSNEEVDEALHRVMAQFPNASPERAVTKVSAEHSLTQPLVLTSSLATTTSTRPFWSRVALTVSFIVVACTSTGLLFKTLFLKKVKIWIQGMLSEDDELRARRFKMQQIQNGAISAAKAACTAATAAASASQGMVKLLTQEKHYVSDVIQALESQTAELARALIKINGAQQRRKQLSFSKVKAVESNQAMFRKSSGTVIKINAIEASSNIEDKHLETTPSSRPDQDPRKPDQAPPSASYLEVMAMLERGETPPGIEEVNDKPPNPNQAPSVSRLQPKPKPWETPNNKQESILKTYNSALPVDGILKSDRALTISSSEDKGVISSTFLSPSPEAEQENNNDRSAVSRIINVEDLHDENMTEIHVDDLRDNESSKVLAQNSLRASEESHVMTEISAPSEQEYAIHQSSINHNVIETKQSDNGSQNVACEMSNFKGLEGNRNDVLSDQDSPDVALGETSEGNIAMLSTNELTGIGTSGSNEAKGESCEPTEIGTSEPSEAKRESGKFTEIGTLDSSETKRESGEFTEIGTLESSEANSESGEFTDIGTSESNEAARESGMEKSVIVVQHPDTLLTGNSENISEAQTPDLALNHASASQNHDQEEHIGLSFSENGLVNSKDRVIDTTSTRMSESGVGSSPLEQHKNSMNEKIEANVFENGIDGVQDGEQQTFGGNADLAIQDGRRDPDIRDKSEDGGAGGVVEL